MDFSLTAAQSLLRDRIIKFARQELNHHLIERDQQGEFVRSHWKKCCSMGLAGLPIPNAYGGLGENFLTTLLGIEAFAYGCLDNGLVHAVVTQICGGLHLLLFGNDAQKGKYLSDISLGKRIAAQAVTEAEAGSDVRSMKMEANRVNGKFILNGTKRFISNGPIADLAIVFAKTGGSAQKKFDALSCFLIEKGTKGFSQGRPLEKMGLRTLLNGELGFERCEIPSENLIGQEGQGLFIFNEIIEWERALISACHLGMTERILEICVRHAKSRFQFGRPIGQFQSISNKVAETKVSVELGKLILYKAGWMKDQKRRAALETSVVKLFISENLKKACLEAIQLHGADGYARESEIERELRDSIAATLYSGTSEIQRNIISRLAGL
jgi:alkylation response protein AidB-like acyl-CoA dehydrogenase